MSTPTPIGASQAVQEKGLSDRVTVVGTGVPNDCGPYLTDTAKFYPSLWDVKKLGYLTVALAKELLDGKTPQNGQNIPNVGTIRVLGDNKTVIMGPPAEITKENYKGFGF
jgi:simple sugar transport system substrate-binding protein/rhamnose transport system substrate-binding protein